MLSEVNLFMFDLIIGWLFVALAYFQHLYGIIEMIMGKRIFFIDRSDEFLDVVFMSCSCAVKGFSKIMRFLFVIFI